MFIAIIWDKTLCISTANYRLRYSNAEVYINIQIQYLYSWKNYPGYERDRKQLFRRVRFKLSVELRTNSCKGEVAIQAAIFIVHQMIFNILVEQVNIVVKAYPKGLEGCKIFSLGW